MSEIIGDFPLVHPAMYGKQTRYTYIAVTDTQDPAAQFKVSLPAWADGVLQ
jgi:carotenoid cleavage dioxygenase-like enzyme